jgi:hypothetical protein
MYWNHPKWDFLLIWRGNLCFNKNILISIHMAIFLSKPVDKAAMLCNDVTKTF